MKYYRIQTNIEGEIKHEVDDLFIDKHGWLYFPGRDKELYVASYEENSRKEIYEIVDSIYKNDVGIEMYTPISKSEFIDKVGREKLGLFGYFLLNQVKNERKLLLNPNSELLSELDKMISLSDFKNKIRHFIDYIEYNSKKLEVREKEQIFLIFNGEKGSGRKYAIKFLERLFNMNSVVTNCNEFFIPKTDDKQFPVVYDYFKARPRSKLDFLENLKSKSDTNFCVIIANSTDEAEKIKIELSENYYHVEIVDFPKYNPETLVSIAIQMLTQRNININSEAIETIIQSDADLNNAKDIRHLVQKIQNFAIQIKYEYDERQYIDLTAFSAMENHRQKTGNKALKKLNDMIGLQSVKKLLRQQLAFVLLSKLRKEHGFVVSDNKCHLVFSGNPGTGKTVVARLYTEILFDNQLIRENKLIEVGRADLIGEYVGHTAPKVKRVFDSASGGVLFIDEAYSLIPQSERDFANEAIPAIIQEMENRRDDVIVIFAGYQELMREFIDTNPGLQSRISREILFEDYLADELCEIFYKMLASQQYTCSSACKQTLLSHFLTRVKIENFGNGRYVRKLFELVLYQQATRLMENGDEIVLTSGDINRIVECDINNAIQELLIQENTSTFIGFGI